MSEHTDFVRSFIHIEQKVFFKTEIPKKTSVVDKQTSFKNIIKEESKTGIRRHKDLAPITKGNGPNNTNESSGDENRQKQSMNAVVKQSNGRATRIKGQEIVPNNISFEEEQADQEAGRRCNKYGCGLLITGSEDKQIKLFQIYYQNN